MSDTPVTTADKPAVRTSGGVFDGFGATVSKVGAALNPLNWFGGSSLEQFIRGVPKAELHLHIEGALAETREDMVFFV